MFSSRGYAYLAVDVLVDDDTWLGLLLFLQTIDAADERSIGDRKLVELGQVDLAQTERDASSGQHFEVEAVEEVEASEVRSSGACQHRRPRTPAGELQKT